LGVVGLTNRVAHVWHFDPLENVSQLSTAGESSPAGDLEGSGFLLIGGGQRDGIAVGVEVQGLLELDEGDVVEVSAGVVLGVDDDLRGSADLLVRALDGSAVLAAHDAHAAGVVVQALDAMRGREDGVWANHRAPTDVRARGPTEGDLVRELTLTGWRTADDTTTSGDPGEGPGQGGGGGNEESKNQELHHSGYPSVYTQVSHFISWINNNNLMTASLL